MYLKFVMSEGAVVELRRVAGEVVSPGVALEPAGERVRKGTRKLYPVAAITASTESSEEPSVKTIDVFVKCDMVGLTTTSAPGVGSTPSFRDW